MNDHLDAAPGQPSAESLRFAEQLRSWRISKNMTQQDLADASGISKSAISMAERAFNHMPPKEITQNKLASAMGISLHELRDALPGIHMPPAMASAISQVIAEPRGVSRIRRSDYSIREMDDLMLPSQWVRGHADDDSKLTYYPVTDQAMQPTIKMGDIVVLEPVMETAPGLYLVGSRNPEDKSGIVGIRRITPSATGKVRLSCDNERFDRTPSNMVGETSLLGRVLFIVKIAAPD